MYEVTSKMAADIHTKGFKNPLAWQRACMLINLIKPEDLASKYLADLVSPTADVDATTRQRFQSSTQNVPNFPYAETPILPLEIYTKGFSSKDGLQIVEGHDPILVVKNCVMFRRRPPGTGLPPGCLRSTWVLLNGS